MSFDYESCRGRLEDLIRWYSDRVGQRNEATTRLHLIDTLFFECLGWSRQDATLEEAHGGQYADYAFSAPRRLLIVEAKREGDYLELPAGYNRIEYAIPGLLRDHPLLKSALLQAARYCQSRGVPFAAVTNGHQVVAFIAARNDGVPPLDGKALVFPSLEFIGANFLELWQALSRPGVEEKKLYARLMGSLLPELPPKLSAMIHDYPGIKGRNVFQADLQIVSELVIEDIARSGDLEESFLKECYCQSGALAQNALVSKAILQARYAALFDSRLPGPTTEPASSRDGISGDLLAQSLSRRPILLIGDVGVGKTMFNRYLIKVEAAAQFENAIALYLDLASQAALESSLKDFIPREISRQLVQGHGVDIDEASFVRGVYDLELRRFAKSPYGELKNVSPALYVQHEIEFLLEKVRTKHEHLKHALEHLARGRRKQIVVFLDNADQRAEGTQQDVFLIAQEIAEHWPATVFVALRPETFHRSLQVGALSGYHPKAFTVSPPRIDRVIEKRLLFALKLTSGEIPIEGLSERIRVHLKKLDAIIRVFLDSLISSDPLKECIENVAGGNVRLALDLVRQFFGSGHVDTKKIVEIYEKQRRYDVPVHEFVRAIIYGDARRYDPDRSPFANLFDLSQADPKEHFLLPLTLGFLSLHAKSPASEEGFVETDKVYEGLQGLGYMADQIDATIVRGCRKKLMETAARRIPKPGEEMPQALRVTTVGMYHYARLSRMFPYLDAVVVDTPILNRDLRGAIEDVDNIADRLVRAEVFCEYLDSQWSRFGYSGPLFDWKAASADLRGQIGRIRNTISSLGSSA